MRQLFQYTLKINEMLIQFKNKVHSWMNLLKLMSVIILHYRILKHSSILGMFMAEMNITVEPDVSGKILCEYYIGE